MSAPTVFISYSHRDKDLLGPLIAQLKTLEQAELLEVWDDTRIDAGDKWYPEIEEAMKRAAARKLIEQCGYWRRKEELEDAEEAAKNW